MSDQSVMPTTLSPGFAQRISLVWRAKAPNLGSTLGAPGIAILVFVLFWHVSAARVQTSLGELPGPVQVFGEFVSLMEEHQMEREKADRFYVRQAERNARWVAEDPTYEPVVAEWTCKPTFIDQIFTSLKTVFAGFALATLIAVPLGLLCGSSPIMQNALNPLIQTFKPVSPLAWLPIVTLIVSAMYTSNDAWLPKSFLVSAITVMLCSLWPTVINTALGVASVDRDLINVARVLQLSWTKRIRKIVLPAAMPLIFTGMRLSIGVGWMVLIAAEMLAQNPGLGKFVWDEFQNGSAQSLGRILVAVLTIGLIGFVLDRLMLSMQRWVSSGDAR